MLNFSTRFQRAGLDCFSVFLQADRRTEDKLHRKTLLSFLSSALRTMPFCPKSLNWSLHLHFLVASWLTGTQNSNSTCGRWTRSHVEIAACASAKYWRPKLMNCFNVPGAAWTSVADGLLIATVWSEMSLVWYALQIQQTLYMSLIIQGTNNVTLVIPTEDIRP